MHLADPILETTARGHVDIDRIVIPEPGPDEEPRTPRDVHLPPPARRADGAPADAEPLIDPATAKAAEPLPTEPFAAEVDAPLTNGRPQRRRVAKDVSARTARGPSRLCRQRR